MIPERHLVLVKPEIHWNTGNIGRTCLAVGACLHLVRPLGFSLDEKQVKRAGLDYWPKVNLKVWESFEELERGMAVKTTEVRIFSKLGSRSFWDMEKDGRIFLVFGSETAGLDSGITNRYGEQVFSIPISGEIRSLNLSTAAGIALYESLRPFCPKNHWSGVS
ncbi:MAG: tRNA (cytidine(34)-2'-O)-methyltransferase [Deltaproteobacteria bacterium]|nr:tRNA (cytidine(34)-2'-O)-methyltransferase [Deltaproteobacteria bacterium]